MSASVHAACREALSRLPALEFANFADVARSLQDGGAAALSRELLMRAVAYRIQELASGGLRPELQRQLTRSPRSCTNRTGRDTPAPSAEARNAVAAGMAGSKPSGAGAR